MKRAALLALLSLCSLWAACGESSPDIGAEGGACYLGGTCDSPLSCVSNRCVLFDGGLAQPDQGPRDLGQAPDSGAQDAGDDAGQPQDLGPAPDQGPAPDTGPAPDLGSADGGGPPDQGPTDSGQDAGQPGQDLGPDDLGLRDGGPDLGPQPDAGADVGIVDGGFVDGGVGVCDPLTGGGCANPLSCLWNGQTDMLSCATAGNAAFEQPCSGPGSCQSGLTCLQLSQDPAPRCYQVCDQTIGGACAGLVGGSPNYTCSTINSSARYGACTGLGNTCDPLTQPCPQGQVCTPFSGGALTCEPEGQVPLGGTCNTAMNCTSDGLCLDVGDGPRCQSACDPAVNACTAGGNAGTCVNLVNQTFGLCFVASCHPITDPCPQGDVCSGAVGIAQCRAAGVAPLGAACSPQMDCAPGGYCANIGMGSLCYAPCDANTPCASGQCALLNGGNWGVCI